MLAGKVDTPQSRRRPSSLVVLIVVLESGERLPSLVDRATWIPARVAMRWAVRYRRYRVQSSTLENNLRTVGRVHEWADRVVGFDLDDYLTSGQTLSARQIESMASMSTFVQEARVPKPSSHRIPACLIISCRSLRTF
jgi:hypothetical protein